MSKFGWSLPPGVTTLPGEEDYPCAVCGKSEDDCICPECPECGVVGDPSCYEKCNNGHFSHMTRTQEQIDSLAQAEREWAEQSKDYYEEDNEH